MGPLLAFNGAVWSDTNVIGLSESNQGPTPYSHHTQKWNTFCPSQPRFGYPMGEERTGSCSPCNLYRPATASSARVDPTEVVMNSLQYLQLQLHSLFSPRLVPFYYLFTHRQANSYSLPSKQSFYNFFVVQCSGLGCKGFTNLCLHLKDRSFHG